MASFLRLYRKCLVIGSGNPVHHRLLTVGLQNLFNPLNWFAAGEQGAWYDPSDLTTLFQDSAGTIPVTAVEQPVGLMLDKSKGLALGAELVTNGDFSNGSTGWTLGAGWSVADGVATHTAGASSFIRQGTAQANTWYKLQITVSNYSGSGNVLPGIGNANPLSISANGTYTVYILTADTTGIYVYVQSPCVASIDNISVKQIAGNHAFQATAGNRPTLSARTNLLLATTTLATQSVTSSATNYTLAFTGAGTVTLSGTATGVLSAGSNTFTATAGTLTLTVSGSVTLADLRPTNSGALLPPYQRVNTASDYDTVGFPLYLKANGTSSAMSTNSIDFTATDKMTVVTGVRKLGSTQQTYLAISNAVGGGTGSFIALTDVTTADNYYFAAQSSVVTAAIAKTYISPLSSVVTNQIDFSQAGIADSDRSRINGLVPTLTYAGTPGGTGTFGNYATTLFYQQGANPCNFNGQFYGAIIRGAQSDTASVTQTENYMAQKTGITF